MSRLHGPNSALVRRHGLPKHVPGCGVQNPDRAHHTAEPAHRHRKPGVVQPRRSALFKEGVHGSLQHLDDDILIDNDLRPLTLGGSPL